VPRHIVLHYAEENPDEVLAAVDDKTDALVRELEAQHREARRSLRRPPPRRPQYTPEQLAEVSNWPAFQRSWTSQKGPLVDHGLALPLARSHPLRPPNPA